MTDLPNSVLVYIEYADKVLAAQTAVLTTQREILEVIATSPDPRVTLAWIKGQVAKAGTFVSEGLSEQYTREAQAAKQLWVTFQSILDTIENGMGGES